MFTKDTFRLIKRTFKRFLTILLMVLIGAGFMVGLMSSGPMLQESVDAYDDGYDLMDIQIYSSFGFCDEDLEAIRSTKGVERAEASKSIDAYGKIDETTSFVTRVEEAETELNRYTLTEGRMPEKPWEALVLEGSDLSGNLEIGDVIEIYRDSGDDDVADSLKYQKFKIVGKVQSPIYLSKTLETSTYKNLALQTIIYVPNSNFIADYYTTVYITVEGAEDALAYSDEYQEIIDEAVIELKDMASFQQDYLKEDLIKEAEEEIADAEKTLAEEVADAQKEIDDGEKELADAYQDLIDGQKEIDDGWVEYYDGQKELEDGRQEIEDAKAELADGQRELADGRKELEEGQKQFDEGLNALLTQLGVSSLDEAEDMLNTANASIGSFDELKTLITNIQTSIASQGNFLVSVKESIEDQDDTDVTSAISEYIKANTEYISNLKIAADSLNGIKAMLPDNSDQGIDKEKVSLLQGSLLTTAKSIDSLNTCYKIIISDESDDSISAAIEKSLVIINGNVTTGDYGLIGVLSVISTQLDSVRESLSEFQKQINETLTLVSTLKASEAELADGWAQYYDGVEQLADGHRQLEEAEEELADGEKELADAYQDLIDGQKEIDDGWVEYYDGVAELEDGKKELEDKVEEAEIDIAQARQDIADLPDAEWTILDRDSNYSHAMFAQTVDQMTSIGYVFPLLFYLVAALVCLTTMTRLIDEERGQIGIFSALGFSKGKIISKYLIYALLASIIGAIIGIPIGMAIYPTIIYETWKLMYYLPDMIMVMPLHIFIIGILSFAGLMMLVTYVVARGTLKSRPAELMRPKAPKKGKKILLEKVPFIWSHLSFISKINARNIFRYKSRFFMTVIGVAGCTSLLVLGFGIKDAIADIIDIQYGEIFTYNETISLEDDGYVDALQKELASDDNIDEAVSYLEYSSKVYVDDEPVITVEVFDEDEISKVITLRNRRTKEAYSLSDGAIVSEKFAKNNNIEIGDTITIESANGIRADVLVSGITEIYFQHYIFISSDTYEAIFNENYHPDKIAVISSDTEKLRSDYGTYDGVESIVDFSSVIDNFQTMIGALDFIIIVIIFAAGSLALVVLINLTEVNISERIREIATFKVLGFYDREVDAYIFKELLILTVIGAIVGMPLGKIEHTFVMQVINMDMVMFGDNIAIISYLYGFIITLAFTLIVLVLMSRSLKKVKMVESLKSVE